MYMYHVYDGGFAVWSAASTTRRYLLIYLLRDWDVEVGKHLPTSTYLRPTTRRAAVCLPPEMRGAPDMVYTFRSLKRQRLVHFHSYTIMDQQLTSNPHLRNSARNMTRPLLLHPKYVINWARNLGSDVINPRRAVFFSRRKHGIPSTSNPSLYPSRCGIDDKTNTLVRNEKQEENTHAPRRNLWSCSHKIVVLYCA